MTRRAVAQIRVMLASDGAIGVSGPMDDADWCERALQAAVQGVNDHRTNLGLAVLPIAAGAPVPDLRKPFEPTTTTEARHLVAEVVVTYHDDGSLSTAGPIDDTVWMLAMLEEGLDSVRRHRVAGPGRALVVPAADVSVPAYKSGADRPQLAPQEPSGGSMLLAQVPGVRVEYGDEGVA